MLGGPSSEAASETKQHTDCMDCAEKFYRCSDSGGSALGEVFFYLLDYVTSTEIFQIGDRKKKKRHGLHVLQILCSLLKLSEILK